mgnify:CR=1 FL=1
MPLSQDKVFHVQGMHCQHCERAIREMVGKLSGVQSIDVDIKNGTVAVKYNAEQVDTEAIEGAITGAGYDLLG